MSHEHDVRDRQTQVLVDAGMSRDEARKEAIASIERCERDKARDERRARSKR